MSLASTLHKLARLSADVRALRSPASAARRAQRRVGRDARRVRWLSDHLNQLSDEEVDGEGQEEDAEKPPHPSLRQPEQ